LKSGYEDYVSDSPTQTATVRNPSPYTGSKDS
jgi:hypothetical protein